MKKNLKKMIFGILVWGMSLPAPLLHAQDAAALVAASRNRIKADTISTRSRMTITAKNGSTTERLMDQYEKEGPKGNRTIIVFKEPKTLAGTRFLTMDNPGNPADHWIFLSELKKMRRVAGSEGSGSFMGTDLSYDDIASAKREAGLDTHTLLREETLKGNPCYVIESIPKDSSYQYAKMVQWINKTNQVIHQIELSDRRGNLVKRWEILELKEVQGRLSVMATRMSTLQAGTSTTIKAEILKYDDPIPEGVFTTGYLETGRPAR